MAARIAWSRFAASRFAARGLAADGLAAATEDGEQVSQTQPLLAATIATVAAVIAAGGLASRFAARRLTGGLAASRFAGGLAAGRFAATVVAEQAVQQASLGMLGAGQDKASDQQSGKHCTFQHGEGSFSRTYLKNICTEVIPVYRRCGYCN